MYLIGLASANKIIESQIKDHKRVLPGIGDIEHIDFFWDNIPFDLKTTKFAQGFIDYKRTQKDLGKEIQALKKFAKEQSIEFVPESSEEELKNYLKSEISKGYPDFLEKEIYSRRKNFLKEAMENPLEFATWNYENQGEDRFGDENRFFLILVDKNTTEDSWKLKRKRGFIAKSLNKFLDEGPSKHLIRNISFTFKNKSFTSNCCVLFIVDS